MTKITKLILILFAFFIFINNGCKKDKKPPLFTVPQELKDWMFFDTGTWWVFKEINSGTIDSQYVIKSYKGVFEADKSDNVNYSSEYIYLYINNQKNIFLSKSNYCRLEKVTNGEGAHTFLVFFPLKIGERRSNCNAAGFTEIIDKVENFTIDNNYSNTKITVFDNMDCTENGDSVQYQILKGVGIINKKNITKNEEWQLIKYHINLNKN